MADKQTTRSAEQSENLRVVFVVFVVARLAVGVVVIKERGGRADPPGPDDGQIRRSGGIPVGANAAKSQSRSSLLVSLSLWYRSLGGEKSDYGFAIRMRN